MAICSPALQLLLALVALQASSSFPCISHNPLTLHALSQSSPTAFTMPPSCHAHRAIELRSARGNPLAGRSTASVPLSSFCKTLRRPMVQLNQLPDPGKEEFEKLDKKVGKLEEDAAKFKDGDLSDLAEGLQDDLDNVKNQIDKAKKDSKGRIFKGVATAGVVALVVGALSFFMAPRKSYAAPIAAFANSPEVTVGPKPLSSSGYIKADAFRGEMPGYVFKMGKEGLGYYPDVGMEVAPQDEGPLMMIRNNPVMAAAVGVIGVSVPLGARKMLRSKAERAPVFNPWTVPPSSAPP
eukprot:CAMPEP_0181314322 /NCGR_PEP_ID=MMETSP1101-20121128/14752_1 /TAXON_ID=46948 /ORGANISM="Rhodomonas abbreviata, Strain Caron Lab Isolate" /LENGTH=294 /DNA_ID=CAMNT_0023421399 /DNA_START=15 /DNA_END=895 /DNA_ORIENTATION=+